MLKKKYPCKIMSFIIFVLYFIFAKESLRVPVSRPIRRWRQYRLHNGNIYFRCPRLAHCVLAPYHPLCSTPRRKMWRDRTAVWLTEPVWSVSLLFWGFCGSITYSKRRLGLTEKCNEKKTYCARTQSFPNFNAKSEFFSNNFAIVIVSGDVEISLSSLTSHLSVWMPTKPNKIKTMSLSIVRYRPTWMASIF